MKIHAIALAGVAALALATPASAGEGWYVGFGIGESWANADLDGTAIQRETTNAATSGRFGGSLGLGRAPVVELDTGYKWTDSGMWGGGFRLETEVAYAAYGVHSWHPSFGPVHTNGDINLTSAFINGFWDFPISPKWDVSVGGGIGIANVAGEIHDKDLVGTLGSAHNRLSFNDDSAFTWQLVAGLTYEVDPNVDLQLDYRYQGVGDTSHDTDFAFLGRRAHIDNFDVQTVKLSIRWYYCPPAPPPRPVPVVEQPRPTPPPVMFIVYFAFDKSSLDEKAEATVQEAVAAMKQGNVVHVLVTGHTDTVGSHAYNQGLSERRAESVKREMMRLGVPEGEIATVGKSFDDPAVNTGPGVRNPDNRRAVLQLGM